MRPGFGNAWGNAKDENLTLGTRAGLPDALRVLVTELPRESWEAHPRFGGIVSFWPERHLCDEEEIIVPVILKSGFSGWPVPACPLPRDRPTSDRTVGEGHLTIHRKIADTLVSRQIGFVTTVPCKQLAGVIEEVERHPDILHVPSNKEDEGMGLCAGAWMGGARPAIIMQNTAIGVTINALATLIQYYRMPLPMLISYRGELGEPVACQVEMAVHTKALLAQLNIPTYHFHREKDAEELGAILDYTFMSSKPVAVLMDATFWKGG